jgi:hypothetical protein
MYAISNEELKNKPIVKVGDEISCKRCGKEHILKKPEKATEYLDDGSTREVESDILYYKCGKDVYLGAIANRSIV